MEILRLALTDGHIFSLQGLVIKSKLHAAFCRKRVRNIKGRDWYDFLCYVSRGVQPNNIYLENKLRQSNNWPEYAAFNPQAFKIWAKDPIDPFRY